MTEELDDDMPGPDPEIMELLKAAPEEALPEVDGLMAKFRASMWLAFHWWRGEARACFSDHRAEELAAERDDEFRRAREELLGRLRVLVGRRVGDRLPG